MKTLTKKDRAEVTREGVRRLGSKSKSKEQLITVNSTPLGWLKKRIVTAVVVTQSTALYVGIFNEYTGEAFWHAFYWLSFVALVGLGTILFTKME